MWKYATRRVLTMIPILIGVSGCISFGSKSAGRCR